MKPGNTPDTPSHDPIQTTPHTESQQNQDIAQDDLEPNAFAQDLGHGNDAATYENSDGAQTGSNGSFSHTESQGPTHKGVPETEAHTGQLTSRIIHSDNQGITNHSATEESVGQEKVVSQRPDSQAGLNRSGS
jgi:hypothetical protein